MGKYAKYERRPFQRPWTTHPVWRGIGCLMMIVVPTISFLGAYEIVNGSYRIIPVPNELLGNIQFPVWVWRFTWFTDIAQAITRFPNPLAVLVFGVSLLIVFSAILTTIYAIIFRMMGPPRYTKVDSPPFRKR
ncbi:MAG: hypothetical protein FJZ96_09745 [Chloroflexi bacterium]|nr:hypothetical protein [Chloroflexota bacterium]